MKKKLKVYMQTVLLKNAQPDIFFTKPTKRMVAVSKELGIKLYECELLIRKEIK